MPAQPRHLTHTHTRNKKDGEKRELSRLRSLHWQPHAAHKNRKTATTAPMHTHAEQRSILQQGKHEQNAMAGDRCCVSFVRGVCPSCSGVLVPERERCFVCALMWFGWSFWEPFVALIDARRKECRESLTCKHGLTTKREIHESIFVLLVHFFCTKKT